MKQFLLLVPLIFLTCSCWRFGPYPFPAQQKPDPAASQNASQPETEEEETSEEETEKIEAVEAELKPMVVYEAFSGVLAPTRFHEVKTDFDTWTDLKIKSVVDEGEVTSAGQKILEFKTKSIDKAVAKAEFDASDAQFELEIAELEMKEVNETFTLDEEVAQRDWKNTQEDYAYYQNTRLPEQLKDLEYQEKTAGYYLEYALDELNQLEQMYTEDELTEESEEIVLKRARRAVESAERSRDRTMLEVNREREIEIPREKLEQEEEVQREKISFQRSMITLPIEKRKTEIKLAQARFAASNKQERLEELLADQKKMVLTAPADGVLYYGRCVRGKWVGKDGSSSRRLEPHQKIPQHAVVMTIVDTNHLMIRAKLDDSQLDSLAPRMRGKALIPAAGNQTMPVMIKSISRIPLDDGEFDCQLTVENLPADGSVMPGMTCKLSFEVYRNNQALVVPKDSVFSDDDEVSHYVFVLKDGEPERHEVTVGHTVGEEIEILAGLKAGDQIAESRP